MPGRISVPGNKGGQHVMQMTRDNAIMCDNSSTQQTYAGRNASCSIPVEKPVGASLMSPDNMAWLDESMSENKETLRLLSE